MSTARTLPVWKSIDAPPGGWSVPDQAKSLDVAVVSVRRADGRTVPPEDQLRLAGGDTLVLAGLPETLALAESKLLSG